jgi:bacterioferritin-associated ferredoxin
VIVCVCRRVTEGAIAAAVERGALSLEEIAAATGAGIGCGCCHETLERLAAPASPCSSTPCPGCPRSARAT